MKTSQIDLNVDGPPRFAIDFVVIGDFIDVFEFDTISLWVKIPEKEKLENPVQSSVRN